MTWIDQAIDEYMNFLKSRIKYSEAENGWYSITTPFLNVFNDCIEIYCKNDNGKIMLSDDGETMNNLELLGITFSRSRKRKDLLHKILLNYGVEQNGNKLSVSTTLSKFPQAKHNLLSAIIAVSDIHVTAKDGGIYSFADDVNKFFKEQDIIYTPGFIATGDDKLNYHFDFQIAGKTEEILIKTFNTVNASNLKIFLYDWSGIKYTRQNIANKEILGLAIINDEDKEVNPSYLEALQSKGAEYVLWQERHTPGSISKLKAA